ncbi:HalOD1 output domain-containing protein [Natrialbaceae archaeon A-arb3/5]
MNLPSADRIDDDTASVSIAIVNAVAAKREDDPTSLPPLYDWIDPDALDQLFTNGHELAISFEYDDHEISVERVNGFTITVDGTDTEDVARRK